MARSVLRGLQTRSVIVPMLGLYRALTSNLIKGVTEGYIRKLELIGVGLKPPTREIFLICL